MIKRTGANKQKNEGGCLSGMFQIVITMLQVLIGLQFFKKMKCDEKIFSSGNFYLTNSLGAKPNSSLKQCAKYDGLLKPTEYAISEIFAS